jgi:hypothetical protein
MIIEKHLKTPSTPCDFVIIKPDDFSASQVYPLMVFIHGNGDRGTGIDNYANAIPTNLKKAVDKFKFIVIAPQYNDPGSNTIIDFALSYASANLMIDLNRVYLSSFSLGGGETTRYVTTSLQNADKFAAVVNVGGLNKLITDGIKYIVQSKLPMMFFHSKNDPAASVSNTISAVAAINNLSPVIPAKSILYESNLHDVTNIVFDPENYPWVGNEIPDTVWDYLLSVTKDTPMVVPVAPGPVIPVAIAEDFTTTEPSIILIGSKSRNYTRGFWSVVSVPEGVNKYSVNLCGFVDCDKTSITPLPREGKYVFRLTVMDAKGQTSTKDITVTYSKGTTEPEPVKKIVKSINLIGYWLTFSDDTKAQAISVIQNLETGKTTYKISDKEEYIL